MQTTIDWANPINWLIGVALLALLIGQIWFTTRNQSLSNGRKWLRAGLNLLLWLVLVGYFLQIRWPIERPTTHALLIGDEVPSAFVRQMKDSLRITDSFSSRNFKPDYDSVTLVGQRFPTETLTQLSNASVQWIPYDQPDQLQDIHWNGVIRQGELQRVTGRIQSSENQPLRLRFGSQTLDSAALKVGANAFSFQFPAFARGRNQVDLVLSRTTTLDTIRFFTQVPESLTVQFLLNNPDFESKTLADWLGKHGHTVQLAASLSKNISTSLNINKAGKSTNKTADLIITEPANASTPTVRKAVTAGKAVLFINLTNPEVDCRLINQALGSRWQVRKTSNEPLIPVGNGLSALPYRFLENLNQFAVASYPVAVQQIVGRVGVSLLGETFPLSLSGDSVTYDRVWTAVMARLSGADKNVFQLDAPVFSGIQQTISINNPVTRLRTMRVGQDTLQIRDLPTNERSATGTSLFGQAGWQPVQDSLAVYVEGNRSSSLHDKRIVSQLIQAHFLYQSIAERSDRKTTAQLPDWLWLVLLISCFTALWIEPKIA